jgi:hypothetical protein
MKLKTEKDREFLAEIIWQIRNYAVDNGYDPDDFLKTVLIYLEKISEIATFEVRKGNELN